MYGIKTGNKKTPHIPSSAFHCDTIFSIARYIPGIVFLSLYIFDLDWIASLFQIGCLSPLMRQAVPGRYPAAVFL